MSRLNLEAVRPTVARVLGCSLTSSDLVSYVNEAQKRLMSRGDWRGTVVRYRVCVHDSKLTWPRWVESIRKINVCKYGVPIANRWYEFVGNGPGTLHDDDEVGLVHIDAGEAPIHTDISGDNKRLHVISDRAEDSDTTICIQGYDDNNAWIRTTHDGEEVDGEYISVNTTGAYSTNIFSNISAVAKDTTNGKVTLSEFEDGVFAPIGEYEHDETRPSYRRSRLPGLILNGSCGCANDPCESGYTDVQAMVKLRHIDVVGAKDWLIIQNLPALKDMVMSIVKAEKHLVQESEYYESRAVRELDNELKNHHLGEELPVFNVTDPTIWGAGSVGGVL